MRQMTIIMLGFVLACSNPDEPPEDAAGDVSIAKDGGTSTGEPDSQDSDSANPGDADADDDIASMDDTSDGAIPDDGSAETTLFEAPKTDLVRWVPAIVERVFLMSHPLGLTAELLGAAAIEFATWPAGTGVTNPVGVNGGLRCWDVNLDGFFDPATEDFNGDGVPSSEDCALHPAGIKTGEPGVVVAVNPAGGGCVTRAWTLNGEVAWETVWPETCLQPALSGDRLVIPVAGAGMSGEIRILDATTGEQRGKLSLPSSPTTGPAEVAEGDFAVGLLAGVSVFRVLGGEGTGLFMLETFDTAPDRVTGVFSGGFGLVAATVWATGDTPDSLGRRIRQFKFTGAVGEADFVITAPSAIWAAPVAGLLDGTWTLITAGTAWMSAWAANTGEKLWSTTTQGTVVGLTMGGDKKVYATELDWVGKDDIAPGPHFSAWGYDPATDKVDEPLVSETADAAVRWVSSPVILCDIAVMQVALDKVEASSRSVVKPCADDLPGDAWARPLGNNQNQGIPPTFTDCGLGAGVIPCSGDTGCQTNLDCDDKNKCTLDACVSGECSYKFLPGCCTADGQCDDFDLCTVDLCVGGKCTHIGSAACCESSSECDDDSACTTDICESGFCTHVPLDKEGCCMTKSDCPAGTFCQTAVCPPTKECGFEQKEGCCTENFHCQDFVDCTKDECKNFECSNTPTLEKEGCCVTAEDCDQQECIGAICSEEGQCIYEPTEGCCTDNQDCWDDLICTVDACVNMVCENVLDATLEGCCEADNQCDEVDDPCIVLVFCNPETAECTEEEIDCDDGDECTLDSCVEGQCNHEPDTESPICCTEDSQCEDGHPCTLNTCVVGLGCAIDTVPGCCLQASDCDDELSATTDVCTNMKCQHCESFTYESVSKPVDIVFVVDQSTSMANEIPLVRDYLNDFAAFISTAGIDYHVILVASRYEGENKICIEEPLAGPNCKNGERFIQVDKQVGSHDGLEHIMVEIAVIENFMRPGSIRQFVMISDDFSEVPAQQFDFFLQTQGGYDNYQFHSIVGQDTAVCATGIGDDYITLSQNTGGMVVDICGGGWTGSFELLGKSAAVATSSFNLSHFPQEGTLVVTEEGQVSDGWEYQADLNRVLLTEPFPMSGTFFEACYLPQVQ